MKPVQQVLLVLELQSKQPAESDRMTGWRQADGADDYLID